MPRKRQSIDPELGKQLFRNVLDSLAGKSAGRTSSALDILVGGSEAPSAVQTPAPVTPAPATPAPVAPPTPTAQAAPPAPPAKAAPAAAPAAVLIAIDGESFFVDGDTALIGRRAGRRAEPPNVDLTNYDPLQSVSRKHAWLERQGQGYQLRVESDPPPTNPVMLNGETLAPGEARPLSSGAAIQIGLVELRYLFPASEPRPTSE